MIRTGQLNIQRVRQAQETILKSAVLVGIDMDAPMKLTILQNDIAQCEFATNIKFPVELSSAMIGAPSENTTPT
jgi:hypothetical protein